MKNNRHQKRISETIWHFLSILLTGTMLLSLYGCSGQEAATMDTTAAGETEALQPVVVEQAEETEATQPIVVERAAGPEVLQTANKATALALRYYIYARLKTEELIEVDFESMPDGAFESQMDELASIWETTDALTSGAEKIIDQAILLLETSSADETAAFVQSQPKDSAVGEEGSNISADPLADDTGEVIDRQTWAENLSKQYDALRGAQRYKQLAQQLGTDTKTAVEQMALAQKIIRNAADLEEAQAVSAEYNRSLNILQVYKTGSKVGLYLGATIATGGGSLTALAGSSMSLGTAGAVIVGGVDCIVDVGTTASTIVLGENHQVTVGFQNASDVLQPVSMVMGLVTLNPNDVEGMVAMVGESVMEWFVPGKITGIGVGRANEGGTKMLAQIIDAADKNTPGAREALEVALEEIGLSLPSDKGVTLENLIKVYTANTSMSLASMQELATQIGVQDWEALIPDLEPQEIEPLTPEATSPSDAPPPENVTGAITSQEIAGTYSGNATLQHIEEDVEGPASMPVTLQLNEAGMGTVNVYGYGGEAQYAGNTVTFFVNMKEDGATIFCKFEGKVSKNGSQIVISGDMNLSIMGITLATYSWTAQK